MTDKLNNNNMKLVFKKDALIEIEELMTNLGWTWHREAVTVKKLMKLATKLYDHVSSDINITDSSMGGIVVSRDVECPEIIDIKFEITIAEEVETKQ